MHRSCSSNDAAATTRIWYNEEQLDSGAINRAAIVTFHRYRTGQELERT